MTEQEKLIKHTDMLITELYCLYKEYRSTILYNEEGKEQMCQVLRGAAFGLAQNFNKLESMGVLNEQPKTS